MKNKTIYSFIFFALAFVSIAQQLPDLIPYRIGKKWGYCNSNKEIVISAKYDEVRLFAGDKAAVRNGIYWGYINKNGKVVIPIKYYWASDFYGENFDNAKVVELIKKTPKGGGSKKDNLKECGTFDATIANLDLTQEYRDMLVKSSPCVLEYVFIINGKGKNIERLDYEINYPDGKKNYSTKLLGKEIVRVEHVENPPANNKGFDVFILAGEGLVSVKKNGKWGYADTSGTLKVELKYDYTGSFSEGIAIAQQGDKFIALNKTGEELFVYDKGILIDGFYNGLICAKEMNKNESASYKRDKFGYLNTKGEYAIRAQYKNATHFFEGYAVIKDSLNKFYYIDTQNNKVPLDNNLEIPVECCTEYLGPVDNIVMQSGLLKVKRKFSKKAEEINETSTFQYNEKLGFVNGKGQMISPCEFDSVGRFVNGVCKVIVNGKEGLINKNGKIISEIKYDELNMPKPFGCNYPRYKYKTLLDYYAPHELLKQGLIRVIYNEKVGLIDLSGKEYFEEPATK